MKTTVTRNDFVNAFRAYGRMDNFSYEALDLLFAYFEEHEDSTGEEIELDVVGICCEYCEESVQDVADSYGLELPEDEDEDEHREAVKAYLEDHTQVIGETATGFVFAAF